MTKAASSQILRPDFSLERAEIERSGGPIAGVDEAGRGPWAGPVVAAAVILQPQDIPDGLNDSKKLSKHARERLFERIMACADAGIGIVEAEEIDRINILQATYQAMNMAIDSLVSKPVHALIDGNRVPIGSPVHASAIVSGDARSLSIAAASIVAKVTRDRIMKDHDTRYPGYGFARHKGYGTRQHSAALEELGVCPQHRKSFAPVRIRLEKMNG